jgi:hypothetical protein
MRVNPCNYPLKIRGSIWDSNLASLCLGHKPKAKVATITLLELFGGIGTSLEALLQLGMVVWKYLYINIDFIARQTLASKMMNFK